MKRRSWAWLLALAVVLGLLGGCGSKSESASSAPMEAPMAMDAMAEAESAEMGYGGTADGGEELTEGEPASDYARDLAARFMNAGYLRREDASGGNWDTRVRFSGNGDTVTVYLTSGNTIYFTRGITRFIFELG